LARVIAQIKIFPTETTVDLVELRKKVEMALPAGTAVARVAMPEAEGQMDKVEEALKSVENVGEIQVVNVWRT
jgi:translation elongation factor EF-1beta